MSKALLAALLVSTALPAYAATIEAAGQFLTLDGHINEDDFEVFTRKANTIAGKATVFLSSPGGNLHAALSIGEYIRLKGWNTAVGSECDSACSLIWLAGTERYMLPTAKIGFHAASVDGKEKGMGNAVVGAYLNRIGLGYDAVMFATQASPDEITYLTPADASRLGIDIKIIQDQPAQTASLPPPAAPPPAPQPRQVTYIPRKEWDAYLPSSGRFIHRYLYAGTDGTYKLTAIDHDVAGNSNGNSVCTFNRDGWSDCIGNAGNHYNLKPTSIKSFIAMAARAAPYLDPVATEAAWAKQMVDDWSRTKPYFEQVRKQMAELIVTGKIPLFPNGMPDLDKAYATAIEPIIARKYPWIAPPSTNYPGVLPGQNAKPDCYPDGCPKPALVGTPK